ncbi:hypothetical protein MMC28_005883 [Mycoblastus sanguinarius]|nr:hypothetical protein [Mycoblastus sanguinarius]
MRTSSPPITNPARLNTTDLPSSSTSSPTSSTPPQSLKARFIPIRSKTSPASPSPTPSHPSRPQLPYSSTTTSRPSLPRSSTSTTTTTSPSPSPPLTRPSTDDSLWTESLSRYSFCSSNSQPGSRSPSLTRSIGCRRKEKRSRSRRGRRAENTTMRSGRHGDEWLFGGWRGLVRGIWRESK